MKTKKRKNLPSRFEDAMEKAQYLLLRGEASQGALYLLFAVREHSKKVIPSPELKNET